MLMPKRVKYRKPHSHPRIKGPAKKGTTIAFGEYALKALEPWWITARQIEAARVCIGRHMKKGGKLYLLGGGWDRLTVPKLPGHPATPFAVAVGVRVPVGV